MGVRVVVVVVVGGTEGRWRLRLQTSLIWIQDERQLVGARTSVEGKGGAPGWSTKEVGCLGVGETERAGSPGVALGGGGR